jgi:thiol-disulfide isomerase/thioredoxin
MSPLLKALLVAAIACAASSLRAQVRVGDPFPDLALIGSPPASSVRKEAAAAGQAANAPTVAGPSNPAWPSKGRVALIDFWASWCPPCKASFPAYARIFAEYAPRGLAVLAVSVDDRAAAYAAFVRKLAPPFPVVRDANQALVGRVQVQTMPSSYLLDRSGRVRYINLGFRGASTEAELRKEIETLLAEPAS